MTDWYDQHVMSPFDDVGFDNTDAGPRFSCTTGHEAVKHHCHWARGGVYITDAAEVARLNEKHNANQIVWRSLYDR